MKNNYGIKTTHLLLTFSLFMALLAGCAPAAPTPDQNLALTAAVETMVAQLSQPTATLVPTETAIPTATAIRTPPALPATYQTALLKSHDIPRTYIADTCTYLQNKWASNKAAPGTVVMVVMHHGINKGEASGNDITVNQHKKIMDSLFESGFQAINMQQLSDFLYNNDYIPPRSVIFIVDDRHFAEYFNDHFRPYYDQWGWPVRPSTVPGRNGGFARFTVSQRPRGSAPSTARKRRRWGPSSNIWI